MSEDTVENLSGSSGTQAPWGLGGALTVPVIAFGSQIVLRFLITGFSFGILKVLDPGLINDSEEMLEIAVLVSVGPIVLLSSLLTLALIYGSVSLICGRPLLASLWLKRPTFGGTLSFLVTGMSIAVLVLVLSMLVPPSEEQTVGGPLSRLAESGGIGYAIWMALAILAAPIVEELLFRGYAYLGARETVGAGWAGIGVTFLFTVLHFAETGTYWPALAGIGLLAVILVLVMEGTRNLTNCVLCHLGYNATLVLVSIYPALGY